MFVGRAADRHISAGADGPHGHTLGAQFREVRRIETTAPVLPLRFLASASTSGTFLAEKRQHEKTVAGPAGRLLDRPAAGEPLLGLRFVLSLDRQRGEAVIAGKEQLRLAELLGQTELLTVMLPAARVVPAIVLAQ